MKNIKINHIIQTVVILSILFPIKCFAALPSNNPSLTLPVPVMQIDKDLNLSLNTSHLLTFDEKIIRYKFDNDKCFQAEILTNIFNDRKDMLIKPLQKLDNKLTVWTSSKVYIFNVKFEQNNSNNSSVATESSYGMSDFDLDKPPEVKKN